MMGHYPQHRIHAIADRMNGIARRRSIERSRGNTAPARPYTLRMRAGRARGAFPKMKRRTKIAIVVAAVVIAGGVGAGFMSRRGKDVTAVTFGKVERTDLMSKVSANGRIDAK